MYAEGQSYLKEKLHGLKALTLLPLIDLDTFKLVTLCWDLTSNL